MKALSILPSSRWKQLGMDEETETSQVDEGLNPARPLIVGMT